MMPRAHGHTLFVEQRAESCGCAPSTTNDTIGAFARAVADDRDTVHLLQLRCRELAQVLLRARRAHRDRYQSRYSIAAPKPIAPAMCGVPASNLNGRRLNVVRSIVTVSIISPPPCHGGIASSRRLLAVQRADAGRAVHLVRRERVEVAIECAHVDARGAPSPARRRVSDDRADGMRTRDERRDRIDRAERVRDVHQRHDLRAVMSLRSKSSRSISPSRGDARTRRHVRRSARDELPGHDVGVVLHFADENFVAGTRFAAP